MRKLPKGWITVILAISILSSIFLVPTFAGDSLPSWWSKVFPSRGIRLGLDLKGGIFMLLDVQTKKSIEQELSSIDEILRESIVKSNGLIKLSSINKDSLTMSFYSAEDAEVANQAAVDNFANVASIRQKISAELRPELCRYHCVPIT